MPLFGFTDLMFWGRAILPTSNAIVFMTHYTQLITQPPLAARRTPHTAHRTPH
jgi:hypothetical protein